jgi:hypothetical protein
MLETNMNDTVENVITTSYKMIRGDANKYMTLGMPGKSREEH